MQKTRCSDIDSEGRYVVFVNDLQKATASSIVIDQVVSVYQQLINSQLPCPCLGVPASLIAFAFVALHSPLNFHLDL